MECGAMIWFALLAYSFIYLFAFVVNKQDIT